MGAWALCFAGVAGACGGSVKNEEAQAMAGSGAGSASLDADVAGSAEYTSTGGAGSEFRRWRRIRAEHVSRSCPCPIAATTTLRAAA